MQLKSQWFESLRFQIASRLDLKSLMIWASKIAILLGWYRAQKPLNPETRKNYKNPPPRFLPPPPPKKYERNTEKIREQPKIHHFRTFSYSWEPTRKRGIELSCFIGIQIFLGSAPAPQDRKSKFWSSSGGDLLCRRLSSTPAPPPCWL